MKLEAEVFAMAQQTEAACLLEAGASYPRRLLLRPDAGDPIFAGFKNGAFSLYFGDAPIVHFDLEGRWQRAFIEGIHYLKGLDSIIQSIDRVRHGANLVLERRTLSYAEAVDLDASIRSLALDLVEAIDVGRLELAPPPARGEPLPLDELREMLDRITLWDAAAWFAHRERFLAAYQALPCLPQDCPGALVVQPAKGDFERHALAVSKLLGRRAEASKVVYLAGAEVLRRSIKEIASFLEVASRIFAKDGVHAFLDDFSPQLPNRDGWRTLHGLGLLRVHLGVESGDATVRGRHGKTWTDPDLISLVSDLKAAGIGVGVIIPVGAGDHSEATAALISRLELGPGDLVSLLSADDLSPLTGSPSLAGQGVLKLEGSDRDARLERLEGALAPVRANRHFKVAPFRLEKQGL